MNKEIQIERKNTTLLSDQAGNTVLHRAVRERNLTLLYESALTDPRIINQQNKDGYSALHYAVKREDIEMVEAVLQCGVDPQLKTKLSQTASDIAQANKMNNIVELLDSYSPGLYQAILLNDKSKTLALLKKWVNLANVTKAAKHSQTFLDNLNSMRLEFYINQNHFIHLIAADQYNQVHFIFLVNDPQTTTSVNCIHSVNGKTPLSLAIVNSNPKLVELLLHMGANPRLRLKNGTPLTHLAWEVDASFIIILTILKSDPFTLHMRSPDSGSTILFTLASSESITSVHIHKILSMTQCMVLKDRNRDGNDFYEFCKLKNRQDLIDAIWEAMAEMIQTKSGKLKLVELAVVLGRSEILKIPDSIFKQVFVEDQLKSISLIYENFMEKVNSLQTEGRELFDAVRQGDLSRVKQHNVADFREKTGRTALHEAILYDKYEIAQWLLTERPNLLTIADINDRYPFHYAYGVQESYGKKYIHLLIDMETTFDQEKLTDMNNHVPSKSATLNLNDEINKSTEH